MRIPLYWCKGTRGWHLHWLYKPWKREARHA